MWKLICKHVGASATGGINILYNGGSNILITSMQDADNIFVFNPSLKTLSVIPIQTCSKYGLTFRGSSRPVLYNGKLITGKVLDITNYGENPDNRPRNIAIVISTDIDTGASTIIADSWEPMNMDRIYLISFYYYPGEGGKPPGWETDERYRGSRILNIDVGVIGSVLNVAIGGAWEVWIFDGESPPPAGRWAYIDSTEHNTAMLAYYSGFFEATYKVPELGTYWEVHTFGPSAISQNNLCAIVLHQGAGDDWHYELHQTNGGWYLYAIYTPATPTKYGFVDKFWRTNNDDIEYSDDLRNWTFYGDYLTTPAVPSELFPITCNGDLLITDTEGSDRIGIWYGTEYDGHIHIDFPDPPYLYYRGLVTWWGDFVVVSYGEDAGRTLEIWKRLPSYGSDCAAVGLDIDPSDSRLYATGITMPNRLPFLIQLETDNIVLGVVASGILASGVKYLYPNTGWMYPRAAGYDFTYLYGYMGPTVKASIFSGYAGVCDPIILGLLSNAYIGALRDSLYSTAEDIHFAVVHSGVGQLGVSDDGGTTWEYLFSTPFPGSSMLRTYLDAGYATYLGGSGTYYHPIRMILENKWPWLDRGAGVASITVTDIDSPGGY